ncbi:MAG: hypothetical protein ABFD92_14010 [Planctomycetaceae bacterium]|nr:hypothetical protein [Planctomycetaceae bacterium]
MPRPFAVEPKRPPMGLRPGTLYLSWISMNAVALTLAALIGGAVGAPLMAAHTETGFALGVLVGGAIMGLLQWVVLRKKFPAVRWRAWVGACVATGALVAAWLAAGAVVHAEKIPLLTWLALLGLATGFFQWLILRRHAARAAWWITLNALAAPAGFGAFLLIVLLSGQQPAVALLIGLACAGATAAAIHGIALTWILQPLPRTRGGN